MWTCGLLVNVSSLFTYLPVCGGEDSVSFSVPFMPRWIHIPSTTGKRRKKLFSASHCKHWTFCCGVRLFILARSNRLHQASFSPTGEKNKPKLSVRTSFTMQLFFKHSRINFEECLYLITCKSQRYFYLVLNGEHLLLEPSKRDKLCI